MRVEFGFKSRIRQGGEKSRKQKEKKRDGSLTHYSLQGRCWFDNIHLFRMCRWRSGWKSHMAVQHSERQNVLAHTYVSMP